MARRHQVQAWVAAWSFGTLPLYATAADSVAFPTKPIRLVVNFAPGGTLMVGGSPAEFARIIRSDLIRWAAVVKVSGARMD